MTKTVIYARYSSELQSERSIDDQVALCREFATREKLEVVRVFQDKALSGASMMGRHGLLDMMEAAKAGEFSVLVVEALDRVSRDQEDLAGIFKRLTFAGVQIRAVHDGVATDMLVGLRGLVGTLFLKDLAQKVHRGMAGVTRDGRHAGGRPYGYRPVPGAPGELVIEPAEADIVRRIFSEYLSGHNPRAIAGALNKDGIPAPRGEVWSASTLNGNASRGHGILVNPIYAGNIVWNRVRMIKDPDSGRRVSRNNPAAEWMSAAAPHLAIVEPGVFQQAQERKQARSYTHQGRRRMPKHIFSGLLKCSCCGGGMSIKDRDHGRTRIICTRSRESGSCGNRRVFYMDQVEERIAAGLRSRLGSRQAIARFLKVYNEHLQTLAGTQLDDRAKLEFRLAAIDRDIERATSLLIKGILDEAKGATQMAALRTERTELRARLERLGEKPAVVALHPTAVSSYLSSIKDLDAAFRSGDGAARPENFSAIRDLIEQIKIEPLEGGEMAIELKGNLSKLMAGTRSREHSSGGMVVAEEGFEPPTRGL